MRVLHIGDVAGIGGLQNWICNLADAQKRQGFDVHLMQPPWADSETRVFSELPVHSWNLKMADGFDIVHSHGCSGFQNRRIQKEARKPIIHSYYGTILGIQIALRWFQNLVGWNGVDVPRNILREAAGGWAADAVIAISPKVRSEIVKFYGIRNGKITVIPGGYARDHEDGPRHLLRRALNLPEEGFLFLFVGRFDPVKNFPVALEAFHAVRSRFRNAHLVVAPKQAGGTNEETIGIELAPQRMAQLYRAVDALVHPSLYDGYSLAVHEALANGLPVIVGQETGAAKYCTHQVDALVLSGRRGAPLIEALSRLMCSLMESEDLRSRLSKQAVLKFGVMDWDWVASETEKVYSSV